MSCGNCVKWHIKLCVSQKDYVSFDTKSVKISYIVIVSYDTITHNLTFSAYVACDTIYITANISSYIRREIVAIGQNCSVWCSCQIFVGVIQFKETFFSSTEGG